MMSSLIPGSIFPSSGFNRKSTPTPPNITSDELDHKYQKTELDCPYDSPVAGSYDVKNTSTKLIILNNRHGKNATRLRGYYTGPQKPDRVVNPDRHRAKSPRNPCFHVECFNSSSPKFEPSIHTDLEWNNSTNRPNDGLAAKFSVNPNRHTSCRITPDLQHSNSRPSSRTVMPPSRFFKEYSDLNAGERLYLWSIKRIYSVDKMKKLKQEQYKTLLDQEAKKGNHDSKEYRRYMQYINNAKDRSHGCRSPRSRSAVSQRSRSAVSRSSTAKSEDKSKSPERPKTSSGDPKRRQKSPYSIKITHTVKQSPYAQSQGEKSRASSSTSARHSGKVRKGENQQRTKHVEGKDRPKSRLGHSHPDDRDKDSIHSSRSSLRSDITTSSTYSRIDSYRNSRSTDDEQTTTKPKHSTSHPRQPRSSSVTPRGSISSRGSRSSLSSRGSNRPSSSVDRRDRQVYQTGNNFNSNHGRNRYSEGGRDGDRDSRKVHRVPSAGYMEGDRRTGVAEQDSSKTGAAKSESEVEENRNQSKQTSQTDDEDGKVVKDMDDRSKVKSDNLDKENSQKTDEVNKPDDSEITTVDRKNETQEPKDVAPKNESELETDYQKVNKEDKVIVKEVSSSESENETSDTDDEKTTEKKVETNGTKTDNDKIEPEADKIIAADESGKHEPEIKEGTIEAKDSDDEFYNTATRITQFDTDETDNSENDPHETKKPENDTVQTKVLENDFVETKKNQNEVALDTERNSGDDIAEGPASEEKPKPHVSFDNDDGKDHDGKVNATNQTDDVKNDTDKPRSKLNRQDSFDESEGENEKKDPDKIEY